MWIYILGNASLEVYNLGTYSLATYITSVPSVCCGGLNSGGQHLRSLEALATDFGSGHAFTWGLVSRGTTLGV